MVVVSLTRCLNIHLHLTSPNLNVFQQIAIDSTLSPDDSLERFLRFSEAWTDH